MPAHSPRRNEEILARLHAQLAQQWSEAQYAVSIDQARDALDQLGKDPKLLSALDRLGVDATQIVWDITVAKSRSSLVQRLATARKQAQDTIKKARRRAPLPEKPDPTALTEEEFTCYLRARFHPRQNAIERLTHALGKYSNPPGAERDRPRSIEPGRRDDSAGNWLLGQLDARLRSIRGLRYKDRIDLLGQILQRTGFLRPKTADADTFELINKKLSRLRRSQANRLPRRRRQGSHHPK